MRFRRRLWEPPEPKCWLTVRSMEQPTSVRDVDGWRLSWSEAPEPSLPPPMGQTLDFDQRYMNARFEAMLQLASPSFPIAPLIQAGMELADEIAVRADGVIADVVAQRFTLPGEWRVEKKQFPVDPREHTTVQFIPEPAGFWVHTHGLEKFGRPEFELFDVPAGATEDAYVLVMTFAEHVIDGPVVKPGDVVGAAGNYLRAFEGSREADHWDRNSVIELRGDTGSTAEALLAWAGSDHAWGGPR